MSYEIIVLDLDGTLTNKDKIITPRTKDALMKMQQMGKRVVLGVGAAHEGGCAIWLTSWNWAATAATCSPTTGA